MPKVLVREYCVPIANLASEFEGYRILQLTDLHAGRANPGAEALERARSIGADLVAVTGDMIQSEWHAPQAEKFFTALTGMLSPPDGFFAVLGNHDTDLDKHLSGELPIRWLKNETVQIRRGRASLNLMGLDQQEWSLSDVSKALEGLEVGSPTVVLGHYPATAATVAGIADLVLAGHTHAGQVKIPGLPHWTNDQLGWRYSHGLRRIGNCYLVVCSGLGYSGLLAARVFSPPELAVITLTRDRQPGRTGIYD